MTDLRNQRRMAASILKCGKNRVWMDPDRMEEIAKAVVRKDIRILINGGAVKSLPIQGISSGRRKLNIIQKEKGRQRGYGSRKGKKHARLPKKDRWMQTIRALRTYLAQLREEKKLDPASYRTYYMKSKGGEYRSVNHLKSHLISDGIIKEEKQ